MKFVKTICSLTLAMILLSSKYFANLEYLAKIYHTLAAPCSYHLEYSHGKPSDQAQFSSWHTEGLKLLLEFLCDIISRKRKYHATFYFLKLHFFQLCALLRTPFLHKTYFFIKMYQKGLIRKRESS